MTPSVLERLLLLYARQWPIRRGKMRMVDSFWRLAVRGNGTSRTARLKHGGLRMPCDLNEMLQRQFYFFGTYFLEEETLESWTHAARGARVIADVGANAGVYSLAALAIQRDATVHAFEPTPEIAARLRATARLNNLPGLHVHQAAVFQAHGVARLRRFRGELGTNEGMNYITTGALENDAETVATVGLDRFCKDHAIARIDLLKLDIQGQEHQALAGAATLLKEGRIGTIFMELNWATGTADVCPATESIRILQEAGFRFASPQRRLRWHAPGPWLHGLHDVIARSSRAGAPLSS